MPHALQAESDLIHKRNLKGPWPSHVYIFEHSPKKEKREWCDVLNVSGATGWTLVFLPSPHLDLMQTTTRKVIVVSKAQEKKNKQLACLYTYLNHILS